MVHIDEILNRNEKEYIHITNVRFNQFSEIKKENIIVFNKQDIKKTEAIHLVIGGEIDQIKEILDQNEDSKLIFFYVSKKVIKSYVIFFFLASRSHNRSRRSNFFYSFYICIDN